MFGATMAAPPLLAQDTPVAEVEADSEMLSEDDAGVASEEPGDEHPAEHGAEHAEGDAEAHPVSPLLNVDIGSAIWNLLIFGAVFLILAFFVWPPILQGLQAREEKIRSDLVGAEEARKEAAMLKTDLQAQLDDAQTQVQAMLAEARRDAESAGQRIVDQSKEEADRQRTRAVADIETAKKVALSEMADQTSNIAMALAKQVVGRELKADDHAELIRQSLDRLPSKN